MKCLLADDSHDMSLKSRNIRFVISDVLNIFLVPFSNKCRLSEDWNSQDICQNSKQGRQ